MRLVIDLDEKYKNLYYEIVKATHASIVEEETEDRMEYPDHVKAGVQKSLEQVQNGQTKSYEEVKKILASRNWASK